MGYEFNLGKQYANDEELTSLNCTFVYCCSYVIELKGSKGEIICEKRKGPMSTVIHQKTGT